MRQKTARALRTMNFVEGGSRRDYRRLKRAHRQLPGRARHRALVPYWSLLAEMRAAAAAEQEQS